jgi:hypothetical protein
LPSSFSALIALSRLSDADFEAAEESGAINPRTTAKEAKLLEVRLVHRRVKVTSVGYTRPGPSFPLSLTTGGGNFGRAPNPPDPLIAALAAIEDQLRERLAGDRLQTALAALAQIRAALAEETVVPFSRPG